MKDAKLAARIDAIVRSLTAKNDQEDEMLRRTLERVFSKPYVARGIGNVQTTPTLRQPKTR